jgi:hypothetical protein
MTEHLTEHLSLYAVGLSIVVAVMGLWLIFTTDFGLS